MRINVAQQRAAWKQTIFHLDLADAVGARLRLCVHTLELVNNCDRLFEFTGAEWSAYKGLMIGSGSPEAAARESLYPARC